MKSMSQFSSRTLAALGCVALAAAGCAKKSSDSPASSPEVVTTTVTDTAMDGLSATIQYKANIPTATFKCQTSISGQAAPDWADCPAGSSTIKLQAGVTNTFKVKAIDPASNVEDATPPSKDFVAGAAGAGGSAGPLTTVILNKGDAVSPYAKTSLVLNFGITGTPAPSTPTDLLFQCKREKDTTFQLCPSGQTYDFGTLTDGQSVTLDVQAVLPAENITAAADHVAFTVHLGTSLTVNGAAQLGSAKTGSVALSWDPTQTAGDHIGCAVDGGTPVDCTSGYSVNLDTQPQGSHTLTIVAVTSTGAAAGGTTVNFCAQQCTAVNLTVNPTVDPQGSPEIFALGSFYQYQVPPDMHVTEYTTDKTGQGLAFYRVSPASDPSYLGNYNCGGQGTALDGKFDSALTQVAQDGSSYDYCLITPPDPNFAKWLTNYRIANNHLEVETNPKLVTNEDHWIIDFNMFDANYEYMQGRSRFEQLCSNRNGAIYVANGVTYMNPTFWGNQLTATMYICTADLVVPTGPGLPMRDPTMWRNTWWIGAFFISRTGTALPNPACISGAPAAAWSAVNTPAALNATGQVTPGSYATTPFVYPVGCNTYANPNMLEMTFLSKTPYPTPEAFGYDVEQNVQAFLRETQPISNP